LGSGNRGHLGGWQGAEKHGLGDMGGEGEEIGDSLDEAIWRERGRFLGKSFNKQGKSGGNRSFVEWGIVYGMGKELEKVM